MTYLPRITGFFRSFWQKQGTAVQGTWAWGANALQTFFASVMNEGAGSFVNTTNNDLDEYKWSNIFLTKGTYTITIYTIFALNRGIAEILFGTTSLATRDLYNAGFVYNQVWTITFTICADTTADMRFRCNGKNAASSDHYVDFSYFNIQKTG